MQLPTIIHSSRGQTLVEALIALTLLTVGFIGIATLLTKSFQLNRTTMNNAQATYLAAEGIEITKNLIDHDIYVGLPGNDDFGNCFYDGSGYYYPIDYQTVASPATDCSGVLNYSTTPPNTPLYFNPTTHSYVASSLGAMPTNFTRNVKITESSDAIDVQSTVTWTDGGSSNAVTLEDVFYDWHP